VLADAKNLHDAEVAKTRHDLFESLMQREFNKEYKQFDKVRSVACTARQFRCRESFADACAVQ